MSRKNKKTAKLANIIVLLCLAMCIIVTVFVLCEYHRLNTILTSSEIGVLLGLWGGELLLIVIRQVLGSDIIKKNTDNNTNASKEESEG